MVNIFWGLVWLASAAVVAYSLINMPSRIRVQEEKIPYWMCNGPKETNHPKCPKE